MSSTTKPSLELPNIPSSHLAKVIAESPKPKGSELYNQLLKQFQQ